MKAIPRRILVFFIVAFIMLAADQATKVWARSSLGPREHSIVKKVVPGYFDLRLSFNPGVAFGMFGKTTGARYFLTAVGLLAFGAILYFVYKSTEEQKRMHYALGAIAGGAVGNVVDRVAFGKVTDFVVWKVGRHEWPAFNIADAALVIGVALLFIDMAKQPKEAPAAEAERPGKKTKRRS